MRAKIKHYLKEILLFFVVMTLFANVISLYKSTDLNKAKLEIDTVVLLDDIEYTLPHAKPILIHLWATWCPTCKMEASNIQTLSEEYEVLTIAVKSGSDEEIREYLLDKGLSFNVVNDRDALLASTFNIGAYPTTFIYDKNKNLVFSEVGYTSTLGLWIRMWWASLE
ncbi:redoxin domain-containing protein [bacterium]|nr:redoxin domain-containing protein [bacterium]MBU1989371.1 redoxin domain-containing protein [bacterium]